MVENPLVQSATIYFCIFCAAIMDFFIILKLQVFILLITFQEVSHSAKYHLCWICSSNKNKALITINFFVFSHFLEFTVEYILKSFSGRNNSLKPHGF